MTVKLLTEQHMELLSLKGDCTRLSESIFVKILHCWKSRAAAQLLIGNREKIIFVFILLIDLTLFISNYWLLEL